MGEMTLENGAKFPTNGYMATDLARYYKSHLPSGERQYDGNGWFDSSSPKSKYIPIRISSLAQARKAIEEFQFPTELRNRALAMSRKLIWALTETKRPRVARRQAEGKFDAMASGRMLNAVRGGTYDPNVTKPFKRINRDKPQPPHVGIIAAGNWAAMWNDDDYIPNIGVLSMAVAWACEALGCLTTAAIGRKVRGRYRDVVADHLGLIYVAKPNQTIPLKAYSVLMHRELYRIGHSLVQIAHPKNCEVKRGAAAPRYLNGSTESSEQADEHFRGVAWLKQQGCTITVAIGRFDDAKDADVHIDGKMNIDDAIDTIAKKLEAQKKG